jgi:hypothetical protein
MANHWKAIIAHHVRFFETDTFFPAGIQQDLAVSINAELDMSVLSAFAAARLALTFDWCGGRKNVGVFVLDGDNTVQAACCFNDGKICYQSGANLVGRLAD